MFSSRVNYVVADSQGRIIRSGSCSEESFALQGGEGETVIAADGLDDKIHVWDSVAEEFRTIPTQPDPWSVWNGTDWIDPRTPEELEAELTEAKTLAMREITTMRGKMRMVYITDIPGQDMLYMAKMEEARAYVAAAHPDIADFPLIESEVGVTAPTADEVAQVFLNLNALWRDAAGQIDAACFQAEGAVMAAPDIATVTAIVEGMRNAMAA